MARKITFEDVAHLTAQEKLERIELLWGTLADDPECAALSEEKRIIIEERLAEHERNPHDTMPADEVFRRLRERSDPPGGL